MWPSSWECLSPDTCVRCANVTDDTCLYNKFTCLCNHNDAQNTACVHQRIINVHKNKFNNAVDSAINISVPGTSGISSFNTNDKRRPRRKKKEKFKSKYVDARTGDEDYAHGSVSETANLLAKENYPSPDITDGNEPENVTQFALAFPRHHCDSDFFVDTEIPDESDSSDSTSSTSSSSSSSSSDSSLSNSSSCDSDQSKVTDSETNRGYKIMDTSNDCDNSDGDADHSESSSSDDSADSTSASSDNSWWQEYEQLKDIQFFKKTHAAKDSGYVSTTSPNDSNKTDE